MPVTPAHCGHNEQIHLIAGSEGIANDVSVAQILGWMLFLDAFFKADASLRDYAEQLCPVGCDHKTPKDPEPQYSDFNIKVRWDPGAPAKPGVPAVPGRPAVVGHPARPAQPARPGHPAVPAQPAVVGHAAVPARPAQPPVPARAAAWICTIGMKGTVSFECSKGSIG